MPQVCQKKVIFQQTLTSVNRSIFNTNFQQIIKNVSIPELKNTLLKKNK